MMIRLAFRIAVMLLAATPALGWTASARVVAVYPSGPEVPANLLRVSIIFDHHPARRVLSRLTLTGANLAPGQAPFLDQELWTPDQRTLTLLFDPARLKTGLHANRQFGRVLQQGDLVILALDGTRLKRWRVGPPLAKGPNPHRWIICTPQGGTKTPVLVDLHHPIDWLDQNLIAIVAPDGAVVPGMVTLSNGEKRWQFWPAKPWMNWDYRLAVSPELEDSSGNALGQAFEFKGAITTLSKDAPVFLTMPIR